MSRAKELRESKDVNFNLYDLLSLFVPEKKSKYVETILRLMKNTQNIDEHVRDIKKFFNDNYGINPEYLDHFTSLQLIMAYKYIDSLFNVQDLKKFQKFCEYNERNLIPQNDLTTYKSFQEIFNSVSVAELVAEEKELEKQIHVVYKDNEWMVIRPLTFKSSCKYGSNTKWCTTMEKDKSYFEKYTKNGVLIYSINKKSGYKVATYYSLKNDSPEFSFWDVKDARIDSLETDLPPHVIENIMSEIKRKKTNENLYNDMKNNIKQITVGFATSFDKVKSSISNAFTRENQNSQDILGNYEIPESVMEHITTIRYDQTNDTQESFDYDDRESL